MYEPSDSGQEAPATPDLPYGRRYGTPISQIEKNRYRKVPAPSLDLFKRPVYSCPELGRTCQRPGAYDAYELPSLYGGERTRRAP